MMKVWIRVLCGVLILRPFVKALPVEAAPGSIPCSETATGPGQVWLDCVVGPEEYLDFRNIRDLTRARTSGEKFNVTITCRGARLFLPWPFRAANVVALSVTGCVVEGFLSERLLQQAYPDELQYLTISNVVMVVSINDLHDSMTSLNNMTKEFDCGPTNVREKVFRNVQYNFLPPRDFMTEALLLEKMLSGELMRMILNNPTTCEYPYLRYLEESGMRSISSVHFKLAQDNKYPEMKTYSIRNNSLGRIPEELRNLGLSFLPLLERLDMSHNRIESLDFVVTDRPRGRRPVYIDMRNNRISNLAPRLVFELSGTNSAAIDLRDNPLACSCPLYMYGMYLERLSRADRSLGRLRDMTCVTTQGATYSMLDDNFGRRLCA